MATGTTTTGSPKPIPALLDTNKVSVLMNSTEKTGDKAKSHNVAMVVGTVALGAAVSTGIQLSGLGLSTIISGAAVGGVVGGWRGGIQAHREIKKQREDRGEKLKRDLEYWTLVLSKFAVNAVLGAMRGGAIAEAMVVGSGSILWGVGATGVLGAARGAFNKNRAGGSLGEAAKSAAINAAVGAGAFFVGHEAAHLISTGDWWSFNDGGSASASASGVDPGAGTDPGAAATTTLPDLSNLTPDGLPIYDQANHDIIFNLDDPTTGQDYTVNVDVPVGADGQIDPSFAQQLGATYTDPKIDLTTLNVGDHVSAGQVDGLIDTNNGHTFNADLVAGGRNTDLTVMQSAEDGRIYLANPNGVPMLEVSAGTQIGSGNVISAGGWDWSNLDPTKVQDLLLHSGLDEQTLAKALADGDLRLVYDGTNGDWTLSTEDVSEIQSMTVTPPNSGGDTNTGDAGATGQETTTIVNNGISPWWLLTAPAAVAVGAGAYALGSRNKNASSNGLTKKQVRTIINSEIKRKGLTPAAVNAAVEKAVANGLRMSPEVTAMKKQLGNFTTELKAMMAAVEDLKKSAAAPDLSAIDAKLDAQKTELTELMTSLLEGTAKSSGVGSLKTSQEELKKRLEKMQGRVEEARTARESLSEVVRNKDIAKLVANINDSDVILRDLGYKWIGTRDGSNPHWRLMNIRSKRFAKASELKEIAENLQSGSKLISQSSQEKPESSGPTEGNTAPILDQVGQTVQDNAQPYVGVKVILDGVLTPGERTYGVDDFKEDMNKFL